MVHIQKNIIMDLLLTLLVESIVKFYTQSNIVLPAKNSALLLTWYQCFSHSQGPVCLPRSLPYYVSIGLTKLRLS